MYVDSREKVTARYQVKLQVCLKYVVPLYNSTCVHQLFQSFELSVDMSVKEGGDGFWKL